MKAPSKQTWVGVAVMALTILSSYLGLDKAGYINQPAPAPIENNITVAAPTEHSHKDLERRIKLLETWHE